VPRPASVGEEAFLLHCRAERIAPAQEFRFHPERKWRFDFAFEEIKLAVEVEGFGRHQTFAGYSRDCEKYNAATLLGWKVLRYTTGMVLSGEAISDVLRAIQDSRQAHQGA
jgi:very-short-patch-repair endonuclease